MNKQQAFIQKISRGAVEGMRKYGILPSVTMAQAILESGWGESGPKMSWEAYNNECE